MASKGVNRAIIVGNLGADPETRYTASGTAVTNISVATSEQWTDKQSGQKQERTEWHRIVLWQRLAEVTGEYLRKGSKVYIEGQIKTRKWQNKDGQDVYTTEIHAREMQMLDSKGSNNDGNSGASFGAPQPPRQAQPSSGAQGYRNASQGGPQRQGQSQRQAPPPQPGQDPGFADDLDDDIPF